ncbi:hypothetical protein D9613_000337 [Agrocybe pediades]|uniref:Guanine nucleotide-binding protein alpha-4 subunit n=1 Tax=Agrocybe pediades TaxID=84607 RepID=A0A8H4VRL8_9AGAR|nr:hypothetical protein D9613_000337 [Agrocybe pediades]
MAVHHDDDDPFAQVLAPPPNETPVERAAREQREKAALQRSHEIDMELKAAKAAMKKHKKAVKVLVLGQSMSGKSTTIKNFQITYARKSWAEERASWKTIILLNLVRSINTIVDTINAPTEEDEGVRHTEMDVPWPTERHKATVLRLMPLQQVEKDLKRYLGAGSEEVVQGHGHDISTITSHASVEKKAEASEFAIRSSRGWRSILDQIRNPQLGKASSAYDIGFQVVLGCKQDIRWLWNDPITRQLLQYRHIPLEESPGFFLDDLERVLSPNYEPTDEDILRARLRTTGVQEYHFSLDSSNGTPRDWIMYDVAGMRTARAAWVPFFREVTALLFLAPISSFNERLDEDPRVYRLEDTFSLWKSLCGNKLLADVQIILLLNKTDLLRRKLEQGVRVQRYMPEYDKPNDFENVSNWFRKVFKAYHVQYSPVKREFISHFTSVVDPHATRQTLDAIHETILRKDVVEAGLM